VCNVSQQVARGGIDTRTLAIRGQGARSGCG
jgi:hypothetical protein